MCVLVVVVVGGWPPDTKSFICILTEILCCHIAARTFIHTIWHISVHKRHLIIGVIYVNNLNVNCLFIVPYAKLKQNKKKPKCPINTL